MAKQKTEHQVAIEQHLSAPKIKSALKKTLEKLAAAPAATSYWVTFTLTIILPMLPSVLKQAAPKIMANAKLREGLKLTRDAINGILSDE